MRLLREARSLARLSHPNVVAVYEADALPEGGVFLAMELIKGTTLRAWQQQRRPWREVVAMYAQAGAGLAAAHRAGIVHRDVKPENVLVGDDGRVRVVDFGLSALAPRAGAGELPSAASRRGALTMAGAVMGTPGYMAPEQAAGRASDARSDQFGFCVALYEALYGTRPFADLAFLDNGRPGHGEVDPAAATLPGTRAVRGRRMCTRVGSGPCSTAAWPWPPELAFRPWTRSWPSSPGIAAAPAAWPWPAAPSPWSSARPARHQPCGRPRASRARPRAMP